MVPPEDKLLLVGGAVPKQQADEAMAKYAINYVLGYDTRVLVVEADDRDDAYDVARTDLRSRKFFSASLQGSCRVATQSDIDTASRDMA